MRTAALLLTLLTGFSGLVYQVAWQKVLASLLGSHSEATAAVLGLFLGGLSVGYRVFGRISQRRVTAAARRGEPAALLGVYGWVECGIGAFALAFPWLFAAIRAISLAAPHGSAALTFFFDIALAALLVVPPTVLMGGTIPLLTQGLSRNLSEATRFHSLVYAMNTAGAFVGALAAGFVLVPWLGLEASIRAMGLVNLMAGLSFVAMQRCELTPHRVATSERSAPAGAPAGFTSYLAVAMLAGFAMMTLQAALNRIGAMALGASQFTFAMVVATFVLCIALGSFAVAAARNIRPGFVALSQWMLVVYLIALYPSVQNAPFWAHVIQHRWGGESGLHGFYTTVFAGVLALSIVPLGLSGALLPLLFHALRREAGGLGQLAGRLYSWNTVGSLLGALLGGYALLFWLDLHAVYRLAVLAVAVGAALLTARGFGGRPAALVALATAAAVLFLVPAWQPRHLAAGLFRVRLAPEHLERGPEAFFASEVSHGNGDRILFYRDDPSTSAAVFEFGPPDAPTQRSIVVNGKSDGNIPGDNLTTGLLALLPVLFAEKAERAFVIGLGTGMTVGELASLDSVERVVVAEISPGVIEAGHYFEPFNRGALSSAKTRVVRSDAYRALLRDTTRYDVIVSEPSNPWVTGVEMLYSVEFLRAARARLSQGGVYAQWFHTYETDDASLALVLRTFREAFDRVAVWTGDSPDLIVLGFADADREPDINALQRRFQRPDIRAQLAALSLNFPRLLAHERLPLGVVHELELPDAVHTLLHPRLSDAAARAFYRRSEASVPSGAGRAAAQVGARNSLVRAWRASRGGMLVEADRLELLREICKLDLARCATSFAQWRHEEPESPALVATLTKARTDARLARALNPRDLSRLTALFEADASGEEAPSFESASEMRRLFHTYYHHASPFEASSLHAAWRLCASSDPRCAAQVEGVLALGLDSTQVSRSQVPGSLGVRALPDLPPRVDEES